MTITILPDGLKTRETPPMRWKCPACFRLYRGGAQRAINIAGPLPSCAAFHPPLLLVCDDYIVYRELHARFMGGAPLRKPWIHPRNAADHPMQQPHEVPRKDMH